MTRDLLARGLDRLAAVNGFIAALVFLALTTVVSLQVFTRFVLHSPFIWSEEVARFLFFWVALLGAAMSVKTRRHFVIDVTMGQGSKSGRLSTLLLDLLPDLCVFAYSVFLFLEGLGYTQLGTFRIGTNSRVNMAMVYAAIPTFAALSAVYSLGNIIQDARAFLAGRGALAHPPQGAD